MTFNEYLSAERKYVGLYLDANSQAAVAGWALEQGFDITDKEKPNIQFHTTIFYSSNKADITNGVWTLDESVPLVPFKFDLLGRDYNVPVMLLKPADRLLDFRHYYEEAGLEEKEFPIWKPHISLSYNWSGTPDITKLTLPNFDITANRLEIELAD